MGNEERSVRSSRSIQVVEDRWANVRHVVESAAIIAAGLWAFYVFIYQQDIIPANEPAAVVVSIAIQRLGRDARNDIIEVSSNYHNVGKTETDIAADGYDLWGIRYASRVRQRSVFSRSQADIYNDVPERSRALIRASMELRSRAVGGSDRHNIMEPDSTITIGNIVAIPRNTYDSLEAFVIAAPVKTSTTQKVRIDIVRRPDRGLWLQGHGDSHESDNVTDFALTP